MSKDFWISYAIGFILGVAVTCIMRILWLGI